ncbi:MAG TPA: ABC transporter ATP-binding protein [Bellilinea sp.]|jgi:branched-chain amino acid transport system ATP-binding protein|nr:ABC transporter ATP-binding protein [Bellilinea sp.]
MLEINQISTFYKDVQVLKNVSLKVHPGEMVAVIGANGAGKTTLINTITGLLKPKSGEIRFNGKIISNLNAWDIVNAGLIQVPEGRLLFPHMTVLENLEMGGYRIKSSAQFASQLEKVYQLLPVLKERSKQLARTMSGGEQQMLAVGRALMADPKMIIFDEPSLGLAPKLVQTVFQIVVDINKNLGVPVLLIEQNVQHCCRISDKAYVLENGEIVLSGTGTEMLGNDHVRRAYLGI